MLFSLNTTKKIGNLGKIHHFLFITFTGHGFEVKNVNGARIMDIKIPNNTVSSTIGKIVHPLSTTIYKVNIAKVLPLMI